MTLQAPTRQRLPAPADLVLAGALSENTRRAYRRAIEDFLDGVGKSLSEVTREDMIRYRNALMREYSPSTVALRLSVLSQVFEEAKIRGMVEKNPLERLRRPRVAQGDTITVTVQITVPGEAAVGDNNALSLTARSSLDISKSKTATLSAAIPASFAQVFRDNADVAMSLYLVDPFAQALKKVTPDWYYGYDMAVAEMPDSFAYLWTRFRSVDSVYVGEIEYTLLDRYGETVRAVSKLTDHTGATVRTYDYDPAVAVAPNGYIGVIWYRYLYNSTDSTWNYNIYYAVLNAAGTVVVPPTNLTNNPIWGYG